MYLWFRGFGFLRSWRILRFVFYFGFFCGSCFSMMWTAQLKLLFGGLCIWLWWDGFSFCLCFGRWPQPRSPASASLTLGSQDRATALSSAVSVVNIQSHLWLSVACRLMIPLPQLSKWSAPRCDHCAQQHFLNDTKMRSSMLGHRCDFHRCGVLSLSLRTWVREFYLWGQARPVCGALPRPPSPSSSPSDCIWQCQSACFVWLHHFHLGANPIMSMKSNHCFLGPSLQSCSTNVCFQKHSFLFVRIKTYCVKWIKMKGW